MTPHQHEQRLKRIEAKLDQISKRRDDRPAAWSMAMNMARNAATAAHNAVIAAFEEEWGELTKEEEKELTNE